MDGRAIHTGVRFKAQAIILIVLVCLIFASIRSLHWEHVMTEAYLLQDLRTRGKQTIYCICEKIYHTQY